MIDVVAGVIIQDGKLLVVKTKGRDVFFLPGGTRKPDESDLETLERELAEETSLIVKDSIFYRAFVTRTNDNKKEMNAIVYIAYADGIPTPNSEVEKIAWIDRTNFSEFNVSNVLKAVIPDLLKDKLI